MREWLSGRALPCQGKCREFESRFPLQKENSRSKTCCFLFGASPRVSTRQSHALPSFAFERQRKSGRGSAVQTRINPKESKAEAAVSRKKPKKLERYSSRFETCCFLFEADKCRSDMCRQTVCGRLCFYARIYMGVFIKYEFYSGFYARIFKKKLFVSIKCPQND